MHRQPRFLCVLAILTSCGPAARHDEVAAGGGTEGSEAVAVERSGIREEATLLASDTLPGDRFGTSVALSGDGTRAIVGAYKDDTGRGTDAGSAHVFVRVGGRWAEETTLTASYGADDDFFGMEVAIDADGSVALVSAPSDDDERGADLGSVRVFARTGSAWAEQATLVGSAGTASFGTALALSADGNVALVGGYPPHVFVRSGATWTQEATLSAREAGVGDLFGGAVAVSADGSRAVIGAQNDDTGAGWSPNAGSARVFLRTGTTWAEEATLAAGSGPGRFLGLSVALAADGSRAILGATEGGARVFSRTGTTWAEEGRLAEGAVAVAISADGRVALSGQGNIGVRAFVRTGATWAEHGRLVALDVEPADGFGDALALSADGALALIGAQTDDNGPSIRCARTPSSCGGAGKQPPVDQAGTDAGSARVFVIPAP